MTKNNLIKLHIDSYTGQGSTTKSGKNTLPTQPQASYETLCDAISEFDDNFDILMNNLIKDVNNNPGKYKTGNFYGSPTRGSGVTIFPNLKLGHGYTGHIAALWSNPNGTMAATVSKKFCLNGNKKQYTIVGIEPPYGGKPGFGIFTDGFFKEYACSTGLGEDEFIFHSSSSGLLSAQGENVRWMIDKGLCAGYKLGCFYYFNKFTSSLMFPSGNHTKKELKQLENDMWNVTI